MRAKSMIDPLDDGNTAEIEEALSLICGSSPDVTPDLSTSGSELFQNVLGQCRELRMKLRRQQGCAESLST